MSSEKYSNTWRIHPISFNVIQRYPIFDICIYIQYIHIYTQIWMETISGGEIFCPTSFGLASRGYLEALIEGHLEKQMTSAIPGQGGSVLPLVLNFGINMLSTFSIVDV